MANFPVQIWRLYRDGFRSMTLGRTLWLLVLIKLFVLFAVLRLFFFPDLLQTRYADDAQRAAHILDVLTPGPAGSPTDRR